MAETSKIEWTDSTFNPWVGCSKVSPGCDNCYAEIWAKRSGHVKWGEERKRTTNQNWSIPWKLEKLSAAAGVRTKIFCASLADVFDNQVPAEWQRDLFDLIRATPHLDWLLLTKRIGNAKMILPVDWEIGYPNVWLGISVVNQTEADRDIPKLLATPALIRFLSCEPLIGPITFEGRWVDHPNPAMHENWLEALDWVICGGESGSRARPMEWAWAHSLRAQCDAAGTAFFMKQGSRAGDDGQGGEHFKTFSRFPPGLQVREWPQHRGSC